MATFKVTAETVKNEYPEQYNQIVESMAGKGKQLNEIKWEYTTGFEFPQFFLEDDEYMDIELERDPKADMGVHLFAQAGRCRNNAKLGGLPEVVINWVRKCATNYGIRKRQREERVENLDSVLEAVGKEGTTKKESEPRPSVRGINVTKSGGLSIAERKSRNVFPTIEDIREARPDVYETYQKKADGNHFVTFLPHSEDSDSWGFVVEEVRALTKRLSGADDQCRPKVIFDRDMFYYVRDSYYLYGGGLRNVEKHLEAEEGSKFIGWNGTKQYRFTLDERKEIIGNKIFTRDPRPWWE